jgi:hypothetical protein
LGAKEGRRKEVAVEAPAFKLPLIYWEGEEIARN